MIFFLFLLMHLFILIKIEFFFGNLKQNVPVSPPTLLALSADGYFSGFNLISASPAALMREKQYLEKLIFFFLFPWSRGGRSWELCGKRERKSARVHSHFLFKFAFKFAKIIV